MPPVSDDDTLRRLLAAVADGDERALRALYDMASPKLYGVILRIQRDRAAADDILQDVFLRIWQRAGSYDPGSGRPLSWLCAVARNRAIDAIRRKGEVRGPAADEEDWVDQLADPIDREGAILDRDALRACLGRLDASHRDCVVLAYCGGYSREELARRYDRPVNTIKTWLHRSLASLRGCLEALS